MVTSLLRPIFFALEREPYIFSTKKKKNKIKERQKAKPLVWSPVNTANVYILNPQTVDSFITSPR